MKSILLILFVCFIAFGSSGNKLNALQNALTDHKVDSLFKSSFIALQNTINNKTPLSKNESAFIYLIHYLSGISIKIESYSGIPKFKMNNLLQLEKWYSTHKDKIMWKKVEKALYILNSNDINETKTKELLKLRIH
jgi:hypothetical protein